MVRHWPISILVTYCQMKVLKFSDGIAIIKYCVYINVKEQHEVNITRGISVIFGSTECHHYNNSTIATISIYLVAGGPLIISVTCS